MVIDFKKKAIEKQNQKQYRENLIEQITKWHVENQTSQAKSQFYLEHLKDGFSLYTLEQMAERISASQ